MLNDLIRIIREMTMYAAQAKIHYREKQHRDYYLRHIYNRTQQQKIKRTYNNTKHK